MFQSLRHSWSAIALTAATVTASVIQVESPRYVSIQRFQGPVVTAALNGALSSVYTGRTYAAGRNSGPLAAKIDIEEALGGTLATSSNLKLTLDNAAAGATSYTTLALSPTPAQFANPVGAFQAGNPQYLLQGGYSTASTFTPSTLTYNISGASTSVLKNAFSFDSLTIGPTPGPVSVALSSDVHSGFGIVPVAIAGNATNFSVNGTLPTASLAGPSVSLPTINIREYAAGALETESGGPGTVSIKLGNANFDASSTVSAKWCGIDLPVGNIQLGSVLLTLSLPSVSTSLCNLEINNVRAYAALTAAPGSAIAATVNDSLSDTAQPTRQQLMVAFIGCCTRGTYFPPTATQNVSATPTGLVFAPSFNIYSADIATKADIYVIGYYQGIFLYKKKIPSGCAGWTVFAMQTGSIPQAYETGVSLPGSYQLGNINDCDVTVLKGASYYIGYGVGFSIFGNAQTWNALLMNGTFSEYPVLLIN